MHEFTTATAGLAYGVFIAPPFLCKYERGPPHFRRSCQLREFKEREFAESYRFLESSATRIVVLKRIPLIENGIWSILRDVTYDTAKESKIS
jgi:hypothetical protein